MSLFVYNRVGTLLLLIGVIIVSSLLAQNQYTHWQQLLYLVLVVGYGHYLISFWYQGLSFPKFRQPHYSHYFFGIGILTTVLVLVATSANLTPYLSVVVVGIFLLHGSLNEILHFKTLEGSLLPAIPFIGLAAFLNIFVMLAIAHPSFYFSSSVSFLPLSAAEAVNLAHNFLPHIIVISIMVSSFAIFIATLYWGNSISKKLAFLFVAGALIAIALGVLLSPLNYVYLFFLLLCYHFVSWLVYYVQRFLKEQNWTQLKTYGKRVAITHLPFLVLLLIPTTTHPLIATLKYWVFNFEVFILLSYLHIILSFLNEVPVQKWLRLQKTS